MCITKKHPLFCRIIHCENCPYWREEKEKPAKEDKK